MLEERALLRVQLEVSFSQLLQHLYQPLQLFLEGATKDDNVIDRDPSLCAERITEVIVSGMEVYIPHSFSRSIPSKPWFNTAFSRAIHDKEMAYNRYLSLPLPESHALYISARNHGKSVLQLAKNFFINKKCQNLSRYNSPRDFWRLAKTSTTLPLHLSLL